jgi:hypothetical protein
MVGKGKLSDEKKYPPCLPLLLLTTTGPVPVMLPAGPAGATLLLGEENSAACGPPGLLLLSLRPGEDIDINMPGLTGTTRLLLLLPGDGCIGGCGCTGTYMGLAEAAALSMAAVLLADCCCCLSCCCWAITARLEEGETSIVALLLVLLVLLSTAAAAAAALGGAGARQPGDATSGAGAGAASASTPA